MCPGFVEDFRSNEENKYVKKRIHFYCRCDEYKYFVLTCKDHPFLYSPLPGVNMNALASVLYPLNVVTFAFR